MKQLTLKPTLKYAVWLAVFGVSYPVAANQAQINSELLRMVDELRDEVTQLSNTVELQQNEIMRLKRSTKDRYQDLDNRVLELSGRGAGTNNSVNSAPANQSPQSYNISPSLRRSSVTASSAATSSLSNAKPALKAATAAERAQYEAAYSHIKEKRFEEASDALHEFIAQYPATELTPNAYYWLGEVYLVMPRLEQAKQAFSVVANQFKQHNKAGDALFKLGVVNHRLGNVAQARLLLNQTINQYSGTSAARLANQYLSRL